MKNTLLQILGFAIMVLGLQGVIRLLVDESAAGFLGWLNADVSLLIAINVVIAIAGMSLVTWAQKQTKKNSRA